VKQLGVDPPAPDFDVGDVQLKEILAGAGRRSKHPAASAVKPAQIRGYRTPEPWRPIGIGIAGEVGVIGGHHGKPGSRRGDLAHAADPKLRGAVNQVRLESLDEVLNGAWTG
jgi:hypothetical protein